MLKAPPDRHVRPSAAAATEIERHATDDRRDDPKVAVIGLGKLGASMAAGFASRGIDVVGVDTNPQSVAALAAGRAPVRETGLDQLIEAHAERLAATDKHRDAITATDLSFIVVPTPSDEQGAFVLDFARQACVEIGRALADKREYHTVVLSSTVLPGACRRGLLPILEAESGKQAGPDFGFCYNPQFIALGSILSDLLHPDVVLLGELDERSGGHLAQLYGRILRDPSRVRRMSLENAELAKVALNSYVTMKITFANVLAELCERLPGGDVDAVTDAVGSDRRVGKAFLKGAIGYGGPCFPRDNFALSHLSQTLGCEATIAPAVDAYNRTIAGRLRARITELLAPGQTVAVLGLAYKPLSHVVEESQGTDLAAQLAEAGFRVVAWDPLANEEAARVLGDRVAIADSLEHCLSGARAVVITTPDASFAELTAEQLAPDAQRVLVVDCWRLLPDLRDSEQIDYVAIGIGEPDAGSDVLAGLWDTPPSNS